MEPIKGYTNIAVEQNRAEDKAAREKQEETKKRMELEAERLGTIGDAAVEHVFGAIMRAIEKNPALGLSEDDVRKAIVKPKEYYSTGDKPHIILTHVPINFPQAVGMRYDDIIIPNYDAVLASGVEPHTNSRESTEPYAVITRPRGTSGEEKKKFSDFSDALIFAVQVWQRNAKANP